VTNPQEPEVFEVVRKLRYDLTAAQAKVTDLLNQLAALNLEPAQRQSCPKCGIPLKGGERTLAMHIQNVHDGPLVPFTPEEELE
jgi:transposase